MLTPLCFMYNKCIPLNKSVQCPRFRNFFNNIMQIYSHPHFSARRKTVPPSLFSNRPVRRFSGTNRAIREFHKKLGSLRLQRELEAKRAAATLRRARACSEINQKITWASSRAVVIGNRLATAAISIGAMFCSR